MMKGRPLISSMHHGRDGAIKLYVLNGRPISMNDPLPLRDAYAKKLEKESVKQYH